MAIKDEISELFNLILNHAEDIEFLNFSIRMKNGTIIQYKMDKKKEFKNQLREAMQKLKDHNKGSSKK